MKHHLHVRWNLDDEGNRGHAFLKTVHAGGKPTLIATRTGDRFVELHLTVGDNDVELPNVRPTDAAEEDGDSTP